MSTTTILWQAPSQTGICVDPRPTSSGMSDAPDTITTTLTTSNQGELMTKTHNTRTKTLAYALAGLGALALVLWITAPTANTGDIAPTSPVSTTAYWTILAVVAAVALLVITPLAILGGPKIMRGWMHRTDDGAIDN